MLLNAWEVYFKRWTTGRGDYVTPTLSAWSQGKFKSFISQLLNYLQIEAHHSHADRMNKKSPHTKLRIGDVFTPSTWGEFAAKKFSIYDDWIDGATVFDPTMGDGSLLKSLVLMGLAKGHNIQELPYQNLYGNELNTEYFLKACDYFNTELGVNINGNFTNADVLGLSPQSFDIVFGNPPWLNFNNLPNSYKTKVKKYFFEFDLVGNRQDLLLGGSRIDFATLIIQKSIRDFLKADGKAVFFMPLSILLNDGANKHFRTYKVGNQLFKLNEIIDLQNTGAFENVRTRFGLVAFQKGDKTTFPVPYHTFRQNKWTTEKAEPLLQRTDPLSVGDKVVLNFKQEFSPLVVPVSAQPRQGLNTCGANKVFFFKTMKELDTETVLVNDEFQLPKKYVHPLITSSNFKEKHLPFQWVLIPHHKSGKPLSSAEVNAEPHLKNYLLKFEPILHSRKGTLIGSWIKRGYWWALLGIGPYSFTPFKVVWEAYGKKEFKPQIFESKWQVNQSLQAYMPAETLSEAEHILRALQHPSIEKYLHSLRMEGTMNWAQPGKIKKLLLFKSSAPFSK